jgi:glycerol uptake facilitator-like aquaporin
MKSLGQRLAAEFVGSLLLLAAIVGSGVMGVALSQGNNGLALLANAGATAAILYVLITIFGPVSGAHFNPVVTMAARLSGAMNGRETSLYIVFQLAGALCGVVLAHAMFELPLIQPGVQVRAGFAQALSEGVATCGLVLTIFLGRAVTGASMAALVAAYIFAAYWFTASTSFANPAVTVARALTQTFAGIRPEDVTVFVAAQVVGAIAGFLIARAIGRGHD